MDDVGSPLVSSSIPLTCIPVHDQEQLERSRASYQPLGRRYSLSARPRRSSSTPWRRPRTSSRPRPSRRSSLGGFEGYGAGQSVSYGATLGGIRLCGTWARRAELVAACDEPDAKRRDRQRASRHEFGGGESRTHKTTRAAVQSCVLAPCSSSQLTLLTGEPLVASVWRRQTFSAAVETLDREIATKLFKEHMVHIFELVNPNPTVLAPPLASVLEASYTFSRMLHASKSPTGGGGMESSGCYRAYVPEIGSQLDPTKLGARVSYSPPQAHRSLPSAELIKKCYRTERGASSSPPSPNHR